MSISPGPAWSDGLPLVNADEPLLATVLPGSPQAAGLEIGVVPPAFVSITLQEVAEAALMAGCTTAAHVGVVAAALRATLAPEFNLFGLQTTTEPAAVLLLVNGPARHTLPINCWSNLFGNSCFANAPIGRALRLILTRSAKGIPGSTDMATFGHPGKLTYCIGEAEEMNPWLPFHAERGFAVDDDVVTVIGADAPLNVPCPVADADSILTMIALAMATPTLNNVLFGGEALIVLSPAHAAVLKSAGLSKDEVRRELSERTRFDLASLPALVRTTIEELRHEALLPAHVRTPLAPEDVLLVVAGGVGEHSAVVPTFGFTRSVSLPFYDPRDPTKELSND